MPIDTGFVSICGLLIPIKIANRHWRLPTDKNNVTMATYYLLADTPELDWREHVKEIDDDFQDEIIKVADTGKPLTFKHDDWLCTFVKTSNSSVEVTIVQNNN